jgi:hypothetical protein
MKPGGRDGSRFTDQIAASGRILRPCDRRAIAGDLLPFAR